MRTLAKGSMYDKTLVDSIQNNRTLAKKIKEEANQCSQERLGGVDQTAVRIDRSVDVLQANMLSLFQSIDDLPQALYRFFRVTHMSIDALGKVRYHKASNKRSQLTMISHFIDA